MHQTHDDHRVGVDGVQHDERRAGHGHLAEVTRRVPSDGATIVTVRRKMVGRRDDTLDDPCSSGRLGLHHVAPLGAQLAART